MCSTAIRRTGIARVVFALNSAPRGGGYTSEYRILTTDTLNGYGNPPEVVAGFMIEQSAEVWKAVGWPH